MGLGSINEVMLLDVVSENGIKERPSIRFKNKVKE